MKLLAPELVQTAGFAERFATEARALATLSHPNIVTIHDFGESGGFYFLLMEIVDGVNLRQAMSAGRFTPEQALAIVPPVCDALQYAHDHGIVHRDIKPENLLLDKDGRVKIADFGVAKMLKSDADIPVCTAGESSNSGQTGMSASHLVGTPRYAAPEQMTDPRHVDHRADIYSLGVVLYELLTGEAPGAKLTPPSQRVQIDVRLDEVVLRALNSKPELRWQTASDLKAEVTKVSQSSPPADEESVSRTWLAIMDRGEYGDAWQAAHASFQKAVTSKLWTEKGLAIRTPLGGVVSRELSADSQPSVGGKVATVKFKSRFDGMSEANETVTLAKDETGAWRATSYLILRAGSIARRVGSLGRMGFHSVWAWRLFVIGIGLHLLSFLRFVPGLEAMQSLKLGSLLAVPSLLLEMICRLRFYPSARSPGANVFLPLLPFGCFVIGWWMEVVRIDELKRLSAETPRWLLLGRFWLDGILIVGGVGLACSLLQRDFRAKMNLGSFGRFICVVTVVVGAFLSLAWARDAPITPSDFAAGAPRKMEWPASWTSWGWRIHLYFVVRAICIGLPGICVVSLLKEAWERKRREAVVRSSLMDENTKNKSRS
ncbi:MAG: protein kinase [Verrucomicrobiaceae bacterium]|nr:protein kinase [Verrucomicrobiaceae bacterium]